MDLDFTTDQEDLRANVADVLARECPRSLVRSIAEGTATPDDLWARMVALGWPALTVPQDCGGLGLGAIELAIVCEELGRSLAPTPFLATVTQYVPVLRELGALDALAAVANDGVTGTLAIAEPGGNFDPADVAATVSPDNDGFVLTGTKSFVLDGERAQHVLFVAREPGSAGDDGLGVFQLDAQELITTPVANVDLTRPLATLSLDHVRVDATAALAFGTADVAAKLRRALDEATMALALDAVGASHALFHDTLEYSKQREQFGVPIGSFQAIKHKLTDMYVLLERARATGYFAALAIAEDDPRRGIATSTAKAAVGDCAERIGKEAIQIHGGIGYTWEHDTHLFVRRALADTALYGTAADHRARIAEVIGLGTAARPG